MREVTINGKTVKLETGKTIPPRPFGREKSDFRLLLEAMQPGESADLPLSAQDMKSKSVTMRATGKENGRNYHYRTLQENMVRIFCAEAAHKAQPVQQLRKAAGWA